MTLMGLKMKLVTPPPPPTLLHGPATFENGDGGLLSSLRQRLTAVGEEATHTLSRSMSRLCRSAPSVLRKSLKCWIWSASSGFRVNSAGNSEIQYLEAGTKQQGTCTTCGSRVRAANGKGVCVGAGLKTKSLKNPLQRLAGAISVCKRVDIQQQDRMSLRA